MQSSKKYNQIQEEEEIEVLSVDKLQKQFLNLQQDWESFKKSNPRKRKTLEPKKRCPFSSSKSDNEHSNLMVKTLDLLDRSSPRSLMSSLQFYSKNSVMNSAVRERREAIESGSLKGRRRLFESYECFGENGEENNIASHEVRSVVSFDESDGENDECLGTGEIDDSAVWLQGYSRSLSGQRGIETVTKKEREKVTAEKMRISNNGKRPYNVVLIIQWFVVLCVVFAICIIRGFGNQFDVGEREMILVPT